MAEGDRISDLPRQSGTTPATALLEIELAGVSKRVTAADLLAGVAPVSPLLSRTAGETLSALTVVWEDAAGKVWPLTSADVAHAPLRLGVTTTAAATGAAVLVQRDGQLDTSGLSFLPGTVWVNASARLTQTPPTAGALIAVGAVVSSNRLYIDFSEPIYL